MKYLLEWTRTKLSFRIILVQLELDGSTGDDDDMASCAVSNEVIKIVANKYNEQHFISLVQEKNAGQVMHTLSLSLLRSRSEIATL